VALRGRVGGETLGISSPVEGSVCGSCLEFDLNGRNNLWSDIVLRWRRPLVPDSFSDFPSVRELDLWLESREDVFADADVPFLTEDSFLRRCSVSPSLSLDSSNRA
jgi:hypothetical protein